MLQHRLVSAFILIGCLLISIGLDASAYNFGFPGIWMLPMGAYLFFGSAVECATMASRSTIGPISWPALLGCAGIMVAGCIPIFAPFGLADTPVESEDGFFVPVVWPLLFAALALILCFAWYLPHFEPGNGDFRRAILAGWVACYFGLGFAFAVAVRSVGSPAWGLFLVIGLILVTKLADTGAYFAGRAVGRTKLCPNVSPNKTVEGLLGGFVLASLAAWLYFGPLASRLFESPLASISWMGGIIVGLGMTFAGLFGDLLESAFKREMGYKDSGKLLPGLGGLWDVTDSLLPTMPFGYLLVQIGVLLRG